MRQVVATFSVPMLTEWQRLVLTRALRFVGYPYVFAGTSEKPQTIWSASAPGNQLARARRLRLLRARVAGVQAAAVRRRTLPRRRPQRPDDVRDERRGEEGATDRDGLVQPADVLFFGTHGTQSKPSEIGHSGIYVGNGWFVHSSSGGVTLQPLQGWYADELAWARRPLAEAGLTA